MVRRASEKGWIQHAVGCEGAKEMKKNGGMVGSKSEVSI